jgi:hypothetical protein
MPAELTSSRYGAFDQRVVIVEHRRQRAGSRACSRRASTPTSLGSVAASGSSIINAQHGPTLLGAEVNADELHALCLTHGCDDVFERGMIGEELSTWAST